MGDLNYRITELTTSQVKTLLQRKEMEKLLKADQLNQQKDRGNVLLVSISFKIPSKNFLGLGFFLKGVFKIYWSSYDSSSTDIVSFIMATTAHCFLQVHCDTWLIVEVTNTKSIIRKICQFWTIITQGNMRILLQEGGCEDSSCIINNCSENF